jgi:hypothetical protein
MSKAKPIAIRLDSLDELENQFAADHAWHERTAKKFVRKTSYYSLIEVLSPKLDVLGMDFSESLTTFSILLRKFSKLVASRF